MPDQRNVDLGLASTEVGESFVELLPETGQPDGRIVEPDALIIEVEGDRDEDRLDETPISGDKIDGCRAKVEGDLDNIEDDVDPT